MGWWSEKADDQELIVGDEPMDIVAEMFDRIVASYTECVGRKPTHQEIARTLEQVMGGRLESLFNGVKDQELTGVAIKLKKRARKQPIAVGDFFSIPLPSGGYGYGRVKKRLLVSILLVDLLDTYSEAVLSVCDLNACSVLFEALCGYLMLADWDWRVIGSAPVTSEASMRSEEEEVNYHSFRLGEVLAPGAVPIRLEEALRKRGRIP